MDILTEGKNLTMQTEEKIQVKRQKQIFTRAIKRDYQRHDFYQKTR